MELNRSFYWNTEFWIEFLKPVNIDPNYRVAVIVGYESVYGRDKLGPSMSPIIILYRQHINLHPIDHQDEIDAADSCSQVRVR
jgi:hypothetical protein